ncbi:MAG: hemerythrin family protein [Bacteroidales bacterium]|nr:hemerythrin family protein [Bacteroidales bacterium]
METTFFEWSDKFSVGIQEIDDQHKKLISIINHLYTAFLRNSLCEEIEDIMQKLLDYADYHFTTEENYFEEFNYEHKNIHIEAHNKFIERIKDIKEDVEDTNIKISSSLMNFLRTWLTSHIQVEDQKYAFCFKSHGLK